MAKVSPVIADCILFHSSTHCPSKKEWRICNNTSRLPSHLRKRGEVSVLERTFSWQRRNSNTINCSLAVLRENQLRKGRLQAIDPVLAQEPESCHIVTPLLANSRHLSRITFGHHERVDASRESVIFNSKKLPTEALHGTGTGLERSTERLGEAKEHANGEVNAVYSEREWMQQQARAATGPGGGVLDKPPPVIDRPTPGRESEFDLGVVRKKKQSPPYRVLLHNDNFNRREYVVQVLMKVIPSMTVDLAVNIMQEAHVNGMAVVIICGQEEAEDLCMQLRTNGLVASIEPASS